MDVNSEDGWKFYHPFFKIKVIDGSIQYNKKGRPEYEIPDIKKSANLYPLASSRDEAYAYMGKKEKENQTPIKIDKENIWSGIPASDRSTLSEILQGLSKMAQENNTTYEVYLNVCNHGKHLGQNTVNIKEHNKKLLDNQRRATIAYNETLNESERSGVNMRNTRTLHYHPLFFDEEIYFKSNYDDLPLKDKEEILPTLGVKTKNDWNKMKTDKKFINELIRVHSRMEKKLNNIESEYKKINILYNRHVKLCQDYSVILKMIADEQELTKERIKKCVNRIKIAKNERNKDVELALSKELRELANEFKEFGEEYREIIKKQNTSLEKQMKLTKNKERMKTELATELAMMPKTLEQKIEKYSHKSLSHRNKNIISQNQKTKNKAIMAADSMVKKIKRSRLEQEELKEQEFGSLDYYRTNINKGLNKKLSSKSSISVNDDKCISCPNETSYFCRRCGEPSCSKCLKSVPAIKMTKHISKTGRIKQHKKGNNGKLEMNTFLLRKYPLNDSNGKMVTDSTYKVCKMCFDYIQKISNNETSYSKLLGGKKKSVKKLIAGKKRVIHIGPKGGKYYICIRNHKKVKVYI